jgi:CheY-like chemotaxis protein
LSLAGLYGADRFLVGLCAARSAVGLAEGLDLRSGALVDTCALRLVIVRLMDNFVYACDHEPHRVLLSETARSMGKISRHAGLWMAPTFIHDAQYTAEEYPEKIGWGHSPPEYVMKLAQYARVKRVALTHHDPLRDDSAIEGLMARLRQNPSPVDVFAAFEGQLMEIVACPESIARRCEASRADTPVEPVPATRAVLLGMADIPTSEAVSEALRAESICAQLFLNIDDMLTAIAKDRPSLAILEHDPPRIDGIGMCRAIRRQAMENRLPVIILAGQEDQDAGAAAGVSDWLIKPFTAAYARTKIRTWLLRTACKSVKSAVLGSKKRRLPPLRGIRSGQLENLHRVPQKGADKTHPVSLDKSTLLWMYGREIASFDTPAFGKKLGEIIVRATSMPTSRSRITR